MAAAKAQRMTKNAITLEWIVTSPSAFGLVNATSLQRAICRAFDGEPLGELATHPDVIEAFGGEDAIAALPTVKPFEAYLVAATRSAKSIIGASLAVLCGLTCDLENGTSPGDTFEIPIIATKKKKAKIILNHLKGLFRKPMFAALLAAEITADTIRMRRPQDGRIVDIVVTAGARAGGAAISVWCCAVVFDEAARMISEEEAVVNFDEQRRFALSRIRPGGQVIAVTSPWAPMGPIYDAVQAHWGKPTKDLVLVRGTGPQMNPTWWTEERCEQVRRSDEAAHQTDVLGNFADPVYSFFSPSDIARCTRKFPEHIPKQEGWDYGAGMDPGTRSNAWTLVITGKKPGETEASAKYVQAFVRQWQGTKLEPLKAKVVFPEMFEEMERYGINSAWTDQWGFDPFKEHAADAGIELLLDERNTAEKVRGFEAMRAKLVADPPLLEIHPDPYMRKDLINTKKRLTPAGSVIEPARTSDGRHSDYAPASERSIFAADGASASWVHAMDAIEKRGGHVFADDKDVKLTFCDFCKKNYVGYCPDHPRRKTGTDA